MKKDGRKVSEKLGIRFDLHWRNTHALCEMQPFLNMIHNMEFYIPNAKQERKALKSIALWRHKLKQELLEAGLVKIPETNAKLRSLRKKIRPYFTGKEIPNSPLTLQTLLPELQAESAEKIKKALIVLENKERSIVENHIPALISLSKNFQDSLHPMADLISVGALGLYAAVDAFNLSDGRAAFFTYAVECVINKMYSSVLKATYKCAPAVAEFKAFNSVEEDLIKTLNRAPRSEEIAHRMELKDLAIRGVFMKAHRRAEQIQHFMTEKDAAIGEMTDEIYEQGVMPLWHRQNEPPIDADQKAILRACCDRALEFVTDHQRKIIILYFGLDNEKPLTFVNIGNFLGGRAKQGMQQTEALALQKMAAAGRAYILEPRMD